MVISCSPAPAAGTTLAAQCGVYQPQLTEPSVSDWNFSYDLNVNYKLTPGILAYATYAKSFKTVGINQNGLPLTAANVPDLTASTVKPELVNHYEIGLKTQFWDRRATFNLAAFLTDIKNFQATVNGGQFGTVRGYLANAERVRSQGVEADFKVRPSDRFSAYTNAAYTDAKYRKFTNAPCPPELSGGTFYAVGVTPDLTQAGVPGALSPRACDISGQGLPGVSKWALSYGAEANTPTTLFALDGQLYLRDRRQLPLALEFERVAVGLHRCEGLCADQLPRRFPRRRVRCVRLGPQRVRRELYRTAAVAPGNVGLIAGTPGDPRTYGLTLSKRF